MMRIAHKKVINKNYHHLAI